MFKKVLKTYFLVFGVLFVVNWAVGVARFYWDIFRVVFIAINFPFSLIYLWLENKDSIWGYYRILQFFYSVQSVLGPNHLSHFSSQI